MLDNLADSVNIETPLSLEPWRISLRSDLTDAIRQKGGLGELEVRTEAALRKEGAKELELALRRLFFSR